MEDFGPQRNETGDLPKLPVPDPTATFRRLIQTVQPLVTSQQLESLSRSLQEFSEEGGVGQKLQEALLERRQKLSNWAFEYWLCDMYLDVPLSLPVNSNPGMVFPRREFRTDRHMFDYMAHLVHGAYQWKRRLDGCGLPVDLCTSRERGQPLCMEQYYRVMTTYRRPELLRDKQLFTGPANSNHIIVCCQQQQFVLPLSVNGQPLTLGEISSQLELCRDLAAEKNIEGVSVAVFTADDRRVCAKNRTSLVEASEANADLLNCIETSLFVVCIDQSSERAFSDTKQPAGVNQDWTQMAHQMIHGGGIGNNTGNRWFDKTIQLIVSRDGVSGLCYEHSAAEGIVVVQLMEQLIKSFDESSSMVATANDQPRISTPANQKTISTSSTNNRIEANGSTNQRQESDMGANQNSASLSNRKLPVPNRLCWTLNDTVRQNIANSAINVNRLAGDLDFMVFRFDGYGKNFMKTARCSPDAYIQLCLQLAYFMNHNRLTATYESASTRRFRQGRVDCIRAVTPQVLDWVKAMTDTSCQSKQKLELFQATLSKQTEIMVENITGHGIDIHLMALRKVCEELKMPTPKLFQEPAFKVANHFGLSTSQVSTSREDVFMGYGPVVPDGYGCSYNIQPDCVVFCVSSFYSCPQTSTSELISCMESSFNETQQLLKEQQI